jgi:hypothetical protein
MPVDVMLDAIVKYGIPSVIVVLFVVNTIGPRSRWEREERRADRAVEISAAQVDAMRELTIAVRAFMEAYRGRLDGSQ